MTPEERYENLLSLLREYPSVLVAFSGGSDSAFLLQAAIESGGRVMAFTARQPWTASHHITRAKECARDFGVPHEIIELKGNSAIMNNPPERCYLCKKEIYLLAWQVAADEGIEVVVDGTRADEDSEGRPGFRALQELSIAMPLREAGITRHDVEWLLKKHGHEKCMAPSDSCLLTRLPENRPVAMVDLKKIEKGEAALRARGYGQVRIRMYDESLRVEVDRDDLDAIQGNADGIKDILRENEFMVESLSFAVYSG